MKPIVKQVLATSSIAWLVWVRITRIITQRRIRKAAKKNNHELFKALYNEYVWLFRKGAELGLYRSFAHPVTSKLLAATRAFELDANKRYDDSDTLIVEGYLNPPDSERFQLATARINQIHGQYSNTITREQMVYVLSCLVVQPVEVIQKYGTRKLTPEQIAAVVRVSNAFGQGLGLKPSELPQTHEEWCDFQRDYDGRGMGHSVHTEAIAEYTTRLFLSNYPSFLHGTIRKAISAMCDEPLRRALGLVPVTKFDEVMTQLGMGLRKNFMRLFVPSPLTWKGRLHLGACPAVGEKLHLNWHIFKPATYKDGYTLESMGPPKCPVLSRPELLQQWKEGKYVDSKKRAAGVAAQNGASTDVHESAQNGAGLQGGGSQLVDTATAL